MNDVERNGGPDRNGRFGQTDADAERGLPLDILLTVFGLLILTGCSIRVLERRERATGSIERRLPRISPGCNALGPTGGAVQHLPRRSLISSSS